MRIWYQSSSSIGKNPTFAAYERALIKNVTGIGRPGTTIDIHGVERMTPSLDTFKYFRFLNTKQIIDNGFRAQAEGYDAFVVGCFGDPAYFEMKGVLDIPVTFLGESALIISGLLGDTFGLIGHWRPSLANILRNVDQYGYRDRLAGVQSIDIKLEEVDRWFADPAPVIEKFTREAHVLLERGAEVLIPACGCLNQVVVESGLKTIDGAIVLDAAAAAVKVAEMLVDLARVNRQPVSRRAAFPRPSRQLLDSVRLLYGEAPLA
ncbi:MAG: hypothetical protein HYV93_19870 [Candidatus Rokubacteria bacterium]|nr:hypothetical protein [Candidatus Rokubacteria bacterium]